MCDVLMCAVYPLYFTRGGYDTKDEIPIVRILHFAPSPVNESTGMLVQCFGSLVDNRLQARCLNETHESRIHLLHVQIYHG